MAWLQLLHFISVAVDLDKVADMIHWERIVLKYQAQSGRGLSHGDFLEDDRVKGPPVSTRVCYYDIVVHIYPYDSPYGCDTLWGEGGREGRGERRERKREGRELIKGEEEDWDRGRVGEI